METTKIIYIVTDGEYSDYKICGVFDDPQLAKEFQDAGGYDDIKDYPVNPYVFQLREGWNVWLLQMLKNGDTVYCKENNTYLYWRLPIFEFLKEPGGFSVKEWFLDATVLARDKEHAIKIVNEKRAQFIAENKWGQN